MGVGAKKGKHESYFFAEIESSLLTELFVGRGSFGIVRYTVILTLQLKNFCHTQ